MVDDVTLPAAPRSEGETDVRRCALARLQAARAAGVGVSALVGPTAAALGVSVRTLWRWLDDGPPGGRPSRAWTPSDEDIDAYLRWKGNAAATWRERAGVGAVPALRTFQAGLARRFAPGDRATVREGVEGRRRHQV